MDFKNLVPVDWSDQRVLTSAQIAEYFGSTARNIQRNFQRNRDQFTENEDFFILTGEKLSQFKNWATTCRLVESKAKALTLWTEWGVLLHVKMLNSDEAWALYKKLVKFYFRYRDVVSQPQPVATVDKLSARRTAQLAPACVYVVFLKNADGEFVKVGHSGKIRRRVTNIKRQTKSTVNGIYITSFMPRQVARLLEWLCQENFSSQCVKGEFFSADFKEICANPEYRADLLAGEKVF